MRLGLTYNVREARRHDGAGPIRAGVADRLASAGGRASAAAPVAAAPGLAGDAEEEFDSPETIDAIADTLRSLGHEVELLGEGEPLLRRLLDGPRPDLVVNIAEGRGQSRSREARVPAILETLNIPFTGSDPLTLAVTLDKECAKRLVSVAGVATARYALYLGNAAHGDCTDFDARQFERQFADLPLPAIVKPAYEGSSKGILDRHVFDDRQAMRDAVEALFAAYLQPVLVEEYIAGDELTVGVVGNRPPQVIGVMRVLPTVEGDGPFVYSLEVKRDFETRVIYECPAGIGPAATAAVERDTLACWRALGCRDLARVDFRLRDGVPYFLEANPLPGLSPRSGDMAIMARQMGLTHGELLGRIVQAACERHGIGARCP